MLVDARKHFNLSHSGKYVVLAIADQEVGIDIERVRPYHEATAKKIFSNEIQNAMSELCGEEKRPDIYSIMDRTRSEAESKKALI